MDRVIVRRRAMTVVAVCVLAASAAPSDRAGDRRARLGLDQEPYETRFLVGGTRLPTLFLIGDSTVRNGGGDGANGQWGWGEPIAAYFDPARIRVVNRAIGGRSSRTFLTEGRWEKILGELAPGDFVIMQFGHNDGSELFKGNRPRGSLKGTGGKTEDGVVELTGNQERVHSYGWYLRRYIADTRAKGATPIVCSLVPRKIWRDGRIVRASEDYGKWAAEVARSEGAAFVDLNEIVAGRYDALGPEKVDALFGDEHTHTNAAGAELNAASVIAGLEALEPCPLCAFFSARASHVSPAAADNAELTIVAQGAVGDGRTLNTRAIQATIDRCSRQGGGVVVVPAGTFLTGALFLKTGVHLRVEKGGVLKGSVDPADYPPVATRWEGIERPWSAALVNAVGLTDVELSGPGVIDGSGEEWLGRFPRQAPSALPLGRPRLVCLQGCRRIRVRGLVLRNQAAWCLHVLYSTDVIVEDLVIRAAHDIPSSDGIDIDSSRNVRVARCDIDVNDDCISIKSGKDKDGLRVNRPSEKVVVEGCRFGYGHGGVAIGSETSGGIRDVVVRDCVAEADNWAPIRFKTQPSRGGVVERIVYRDFRLNDVRRAFEFNMAWRMVPPLEPPAAVLPVVRDVRLVNVSGSAVSAGLLRGLEGSPIRDVSFENCQLSARTGLVLEHVEHVDLDGLTLRVSEGPAVIRRQPPPSPAPPLTAAPAVAP